MPFADFLKLRVYSKTILFNIDLSAKTDHKSLKQIGYSLCFKCQIFSNSLNVQIFLELLDLWSLLVSGQGLHLFV